MSEHYGPEGDVARHLSLDALEAKFEALAPAPKDHGKVCLLVSRRADGVRDTPQRAQLTPEGGMPGDRWHRRTPDAPDTQLTVMQRDVAETIANGQALSLFGDNLLVDLDLSEDNLPVGSRVRVGGATLEVTPEPHTGCKKFAARVGQDALRYISRKELRDRHLRGVYWRVVEAGPVAVGDAIDVLSRGH